MYLKLLAKKIYYSSSGHHALDHEEWVLTARSGSCSFVRSVHQLNLAYNCSAYFDDPDLTSANVVSNNFDSVSPNCNAEAEAGTCKSDPFFMSAVCDKLYCNDKYKSFQNCEFSGYDTSQQISAQNECGELCFANPNCTHFTWGYLSYCYMKTSPKGLSKYYAQGALCGYIPSRVHITINFGWQDGEKGLTTWANDCDFQGNDIGNVNGGKKEDCGMSCIAHSTCTHFTWSSIYGSCLMKSWGSGSNPPEADLLNNKGLCGWVKNRVKSA